jgi:hypothetical protein
MEMLMIQKSLKQLRPRPSNNISYVQKVQTLIEAEEISVPIDDLLPQGNSNAGKRTQIFEAAVVLVAMAGPKLTASKIKSVMNNNEFSTIAKSWTEALLQDKRNHEPLSLWYSNLGFPISKLGLMKDFIHQNIGSVYYKGLPSSFEYKSAQKDNTADVVLIVDGNKSDLFNILNDIKALPEDEQVIRAKSESDGKVTISDSKGKTISFYQISAKKGVGDGRIGKIGSFINKNIIKGTPHLPSNLLDLLQKEEYSHLSEKEIKLFTEGFFGDLVQKFKSVATLGIKVFLGWVQKIYGKVATDIVKISQGTTNKILSKNKGVVAANNILKEVELSSLVEAVGPLINITPKMKKELEALKTLVKSINIVHQSNVALVEKLNSRPKMKVRPRPPIYFPNPQGGEIDINYVSKEIEKISKQKTVSRDKFKLVVSIVANFAANIAINAMLKSVERSVDKYEDLTESLFAFSSTLEAEAKFGNTALPLVVCYGGLTGNNTVLGKREDYTKRNTQELVEKGKQLNNFYIAVIEIYKSAGVNPYNIAKFHLVTGFEEKENKPFPKFTMISISNSSGSKFYTKIEADAPSPKKSVVMWT